MTYTTIAVIYNPNSTGSGEKLAKDFKKKVHTALPKQKIELIETEHAGHGGELAYKIAKASKRPLIISASGDGGYNEVINGALTAQKEGATPTTGLLPAGNANDHYTNLHDEDIVAQIVEGKTKHIDALKISTTVDGKKIERFAHSYIGFGLTPKVGKELNKTTLNAVNEVLLVARTLFTLRSVKLRINKETHHYYSVVFSNIDRMSKYLKISQPSSIDDGKFEVTIFRRHSKLKLISTLLKATVTPAEEDVQANSFKMATITKTLVQLDGEIVTIDPDSNVAVTCEKQLLTCVV